MTPDICFLVFAHVYHVCQHFDHVWQFYSNCQNLVLVENYQVKFHLTVTNHVKSIFQNDLI